MNMASEWRTEDGAGLFVLCRHLRLRQERLLQRQRFVMPGHAEREEAHSVRDERTEVVPRNYFVFYIQLKLCAEDVFLLYRIRASKHANLHCTARLQKHVLTP